MVVYMGFYMALYCFIYSAHLCPIYDQDCNLLPTKQGPISVTSSVTCGELRLGLTGPNELGPNFVG